MRIYIADVNDRGTAELEEQLRLRFAGKGEPEPEIAREYDGDDEDSMNVVFLRADSPNPPELFWKLRDAAPEPTRYAVWMARSEEYSLEAINHQADAFLVLPPTPEKLERVFRQLEMRRKCRAARGLVQNA